MKINIEQKLVTVCLISLLVVGVIMSYVMATGVRSISKLVSSVYTGAILPLSDVHDLSRSIHQIDSDLLRAFDYESTERERLLESVFENEHLFHTVLDKYEKEDTIVAEPDMQELLRKIGVLDDLNRREQASLKLTKSYSPIISSNIKAIVDALHSKRQKEAEMLYRESIQPLLDNIENSIEVFKKLQLEQARYSSEESNRNASILSRNIVTIILIGILFVGVITFSLSRAVISPLRILTKKLTNAAEAFKMSSEEQAAVSLEQAQQIIWAVKQSNPSNQQSLASQRTIQALYSIDESSKRFSESTKKAVTDAEQIVSLTKDIKETAGIY
jgi:hypothetical protein